MRSISFCVHTGSYHFLNVRSYLRWSFAFLIGFENNSVSATKAVSAEIARVAYVLLLPRLSDNKYALEHLGGRSGFGSSTNSACEQTPGKLTAKSAASPLDVTKLPHYYTLARRSSNIADAELDALLLLPTKSLPPALTSPEPTQRLRAVAAQGGALEMLFACYVCISRGRAGHSPRRISGQNNAWRRLRFS